MAIHKKQRFRCEVQGLWTVFHPEAGGPPLVEWVLPNRLLAKTRLFFRTQDDPRERLAQEPDALIIGTELGSAEWGEGALSCADPHIVRYCIYTTKQVEDLHLVEKTPEPGRTEILIEWIIEYYNFSTIVRNGFRHMVLFILPSPLKRRVSEYYFTRDYDL